MYSFQKNKSLFKNTIKNILIDTKNYELAEAAFPAYANPNPLIDLLFWKRLEIPFNYLKSQNKKFHILDFGFGSGVMSHLLAQNGHSIIGVDRELSPIQMIKKKIAFPPNCILEESTDSYLSSIPKNSFDVIIALDVLEHVEDLQGTIDFFRTLLKPSGEIIISGPSENIFYKLGRKIAGKDYTGEYHVTNIDHIKSEFEKKMKVKTLAKLYPPVTLFEIFVANEK
ncbi:MAG: class I SAM-dependent methyltransferase [Cytophagales bacterium]|nr:class I SAM-dependent methyltransferase [Cytophagales bacterium]